MKSNSCFTVRSALSNVHTTRLESMNLITLSQQACPITKDPCHGGLTSLGRAHPWNHSRDSPGWPIKTKLLKCQSDTVWHSNPNENFENKVFDVQISLMIPMINDPAHDALFFMENHPLEIWIYHLLTMTTIIVHLIIFPIFWPSPEQGLLQLGWNMSSRANAYDIYPTNAGISPHS